MDNTRKICILTMAMVASLALNAFPRHHHHHHHGTGFAIGAGILGAGLIASAIYDATRPRYVAPVAPVVVTPAPVVAAQPIVVQQPAVTLPVVQQPVVQQVAPEPRMQNVWIEGRYVEQVNGLGQTVRVWQPGHYEQHPIQ
jgi:hypothetical protein